MKAFATAFYNEKASVAAFTNYCIQEEWSIVVSFQKYRCQNRGTLVLKHTAPNCKLRICTFTPSGPFLGIGSGKVIKINSWINYLHILITKTWIPGCANKVWLVYRLRPLCLSHNFLAWLGKILWRTRIAVLLVLYVAMLYPSIRASLAQCADCTVATRIQETTVVLPPAGVSSQDTGTGWPSFLLSSDPSRVVKNGQCGTVQWERF